MYLKFLYLSCRLGTTTVRLSCVYLFTDADFVGLTLLPILQGLGAW
jgi:hypothetical protein